MDSIFKKLAVALALLVLFVFMALIGAAWYMGVFSGVKIDTGIKGPYQTVCLRNTGTYHKIPAKIEQVAQYLKQKNIRTGDAIAVFQDDPAVTPEEELTSYAGLIVYDSLSLDSSFVLLPVQKRNVVIAEIEAHPLLAPFKTYPRINEWLQDNNREVDDSLPGVELYKNSGLVQVQLALKSNKQNVQE